MAHSKNITADEYSHLSTEDKKAYVKNTEGPGYVHREPTSTVRARRANRDRKLTIAEYDRVSDKANWMLATDGSNTYVRRPDADPDWDESELDSVPTPAQDIQGCAARIEETLSRLGDAPEVESVRMSIKNELKKMQGFASKSN